MVVAAITCKMFNLCNKNSKILSIPLTCKVPRQVIVELSIVEVSLDKQTDIELTEFLLDKAAEAKRDVGFRGTDFVKMLRTSGGYQTVLTLLRNKDISPGFTDLCMLSRADLTVEAIVVETKWRNHFDKLLIEKAESRLKAIKYRFERFRASHDPAIELASSDLNNPTDSSTWEAGTVERRHWWVNQNQTYGTEVPGGFLWSPKTRSDGVRNQFYENMREVAAGDVVFSFCKGLIKAIGVAKGPA